jgi:hypothetical protein
MAARFLAAINRQIARVILTLLSVGAVGTVHAMSVIPPTFPELVQLATQIVRVEILDVSCRYDTAPTGERPIHTYVKCHVLKTLKGTPQESITLRFLGGRVGDDQLEISDMPSFAVGEKYVFFVAQNGTAFCPLVRVMHGSYPVVQDGTAAGTERILRNNREPLLEVAQVGRPMAEGVGQTIARETVSSALSLADFETAIADEIIHGSKQ